MNATKQSSNVSYRLMRQPLNKEIIKEKEKEKDIKNNACEK